MHHELRSEITIDATPEAVWEVLTDLDRYADWNPYIVSSEGRAEEGQRLTNRMQPPGGTAMTFKPTVTAAERATRFEWLGRLGVPGIFDGRHRFDLVASGDGGTTLIQSEQFAGVLVRFMRTSLNTATMAGFEAMNNALKARVEATAGVAS